MKNKYCERKYRSAVKLLKEKPAKLEHKNAENYERQNI